MIRLGPNPINCLQATGSIHLLVNEVWMKITSHWSQFADARQLKYFVFKREDNIQFDYTCALKKTWYQVIK